MSVPLFPKLQPKLVDASWFDVDQPCADEDEVTQLENQHREWLHSISKRDFDLIPIGKKRLDETLDDDDDEEDEDDNDDDDDSESHDEEEEDEIEMDLSHDVSPSNMSI